MNPTERKTDTGAESVAAPRYYANFRNYIVSANPDGSIPLNAKCFGSVIQDSVELDRMIEQANAANYLLSALEEIVGAITPADGVGVRSKIDKAYAAIKKARG